MKKLQIIDKLDFFVAELDPQGRLTWLNQTAITVGGHHYQDLIRVPFHEGPWWQHSPSAIDKIKRSLDHVIRTKTPCPPVDVTVVMVHNQYLKIEMHMNPNLDAEGNLVSILPHAVTIRSLKTTGLDDLAAAIQRELKENENKLAIVKTVMDRVPRPMTLVDAKGVLIFDNLEARKIVGTDTVGESKDLEDWSGKFWSADGSEMPATQTPLGRCLQSQKDVEDILFIVFDSRPDILFELNVLASPVIQDGEMIGAICYWTILSEKPYVNS